MRVFCRVLNIPVAHVDLDGPQIQALVYQRGATGMSEGMCIPLHPQGVFSGCGKELLEAVHRDCTTSFIPEHEPRRWLIVRLVEALEEHELPRIGNRVHGTNSVLEALNSNLPGLEVDVLPLDIGSLADPQTVVERDQDQALITILVAGPLAERFADGLDFRRRQMALAPELIIGLASAGYFPRFSEFCLLGIKTMIITRKVYPKLSPMALRRANGFALVCGSHRVLSQSAAAGGKGLDCFYEGGCGCISDFPSPGGVRAS